MTKFKVGDKVRIKGTAECLGFDLHGQVGIIIKDDGTNFAQYRLDIGKGQCNLYGSEELELIESKEPMGIDEINKEFDLAREDEGYFDDWADWEFDYCDIDKPVVSDVSTETLNKVNEDWQETACQNITAVQQAYQDGLKHSGLEGLAAQCLKTATELHFADELHDNYDIAEFAAKMYKDFLKALEK